MEYNNGQVLKQTQSVESTIHGIKLMNCTIMEKVDLMRDMNIECKL